MSLAYFCLKALEGTDRFCMQDWASGPSIQTRPGVPLLNFRGQPSKHANGYVSPDVLDEYKNSLSETTVAKLITEMPTRRDEEEDEMTEKVKSSLDPRAAYHA
eukprot:530488-Rhodomonas_salina.4